MRTCLLLNIFALGGSALVQHTGCSAHQSRPARRIGTQRLLDLGPPFEELGLPAATLQEALRADIMRRRTELLLLGWLGRGYLFAPWLFNTVLPAVFQFTAYNMSAAVCYEQAGMVDCTLREGSVGGAKGIPFRFRLETTATRSILGAQLVGVGCDLTRANAGQITDGSVQMSEERMRALTCAIEADASTKRLLVQAITRAIFPRLIKVAEAVQQSVDLVCCAEPVDFVPRQDWYALEGTGYKWVQQVSGYYFAASRLQDVRFESIAEGVQFTFYLDPTEPFNTDDTTRIVNPEVINCLFLD